MGEGPYGEAACTLLAAHAGDLGVLLEAYDRQVGDMLADQAGMVMTTASRVPATSWSATAGNCWSTGTPLVAPERDLWVLDAGDGSIVRAYEECTRSAVRGEVLAFYRRWYDLAGVAGYLALFGQPHPDDADSRESWRNLVHFLRPRER